MCDHVTTIQVRTRCYTGSVNPKNENPVAHGNVCVEVECTLCGAHRLENHNGGQVEEGAWGPSREERAAKARAAEARVRQLIGAAPAPIQLVRGEQTTRVSIDDDGMLTAVGEATGEDIVAAAPKFVEFAASLRQAVIEAEELRAAV
jgi:hypothetical protein